MQHVATFTYTDPNPDSSLFSKTIERGNTGGKNEEKRETSAKNLDFDFVNFPILSASNQNLKKRITQSSLDASKSNWRASEIGKHMMHPNKNNNNNNNNNNNVHNNNNNNVHSNNFLEKKPHSIPSKPIFKPYDFENDGAKSNLNLEEIWNKLGPKTIGTEWRRALHILEKEVQEEGLDLNENVGLVNLFMSKYAGAGFSEDAEKFLRYAFKHEFKPDVNTYNSLLTAFNNDKRLSNFEKLEKIEEFIEWMNKDQIDLDAQTYQNAIRASFNNKEMSSVTYWIQEAQKRNQATSIEVLKEILHGYISINHIQIAEKLFEQLITKIPTDLLSTPFNFFLRWYSTYNHPEKFQECLERMNKMKVEQDDMTYSIMIAHALNSKQGIIIQDSPIFKDFKIIDPRWQKANEIFERWKKTKKIEDNRSQDLNCQNMTMNVLQVQIVNWFINSREKRVFVHADPKIGNDIFKNVFPFVKNHFNEKLRIFKQHHSDSLTLRIERF